MEQCIRNLNQQNIKTNENPNPNFSFSSENTEYETLWIEQIKMDNDEHNQQKHIFNRC